MKNDELRFLPAAEETELEAFVEAFEAALEMSDHADWRAFVPSTDHHLFREVATEIIRTDLEYRWSSGDQVRVADYRSSLPELFESTPHLTDVAFEEYRQRRLAGEAADRREYAAEYGVDTTTWPADDTITDGAAASQCCGDEESAAIGHALDAFDRFADIPDPGTRFGEFELVDLLGEGAFARVFLARQTALANRPVAVKIAADRTFEADRLARLQHTNIVPVFSTFRTGGLHAVCMPYLGSVTLHDVLSILGQRSCQRTSGKDIVDALLDASHGDEREQVASSYSHLASRSYVDAVIWILSRVVDGLSRAHQLSIVHGDLKPANILLAHDGEPRLLDFNLSSEADITAPALAIVGGTLPYMSPSQLRSIRTGGLVTSADDIFSIGVIAYEMLTRQRAFPQRIGEFDEIVADMIEDRQYLTSTKLSQSWEGVPASVRSLVRCCWDPPSASRYPTAAELGEDLRRHLENRRLRYAPDHSLVERVGKWARRHPRLLSGGMVATVAACLLLLALAAVFIRGRRIATLEAGNIFATFQDKRTLARSALSAPSAQRSLDEAAISAGEKAVGMYAVLSDEQWQAAPRYRRLFTAQREQLDQQLAELLYLMAERRLSAAAEDPDARQAAQRLRSKALSLWGDDAPPTALSQQSTRMVSRKGSSTAGQMPAVATIPRMKSTFFWTRPRIYEKATTSPRNKHFVSSAIRIHSTHPFGFCSATRQSAGVRWPKPKRVIPHSLACSRNRTSATFTAA